MLKTICGGIQMGRLKYYAIITGKGKYYHSPYVIEAMSKAEAERAYKLYESTPKRYYSIMKVDSDSARRNLFLLKRKQYISELKKRKRR